MVYLVLRPDCSYTNCMKESRMLSVWLGVPKVQCKIVVQLLVDFLINTFSCAYAVSCEVFRSYRTSRYTLAYMSCLPHGRVTDIKYMRSLML